MKAQSPSRAFATLLPSRGRLVRTLLSYGVAAACLYWVFHDLHLPALVQSLAGIQWGWVPLAVVLDLLIYVCAAWEWQLLLRPAGHLPFLRVLQALFAGRFANDVLPVHVGYVIRIYLVARWMEQRIAAIVPSLLVERLFDGSWLVLGIGLLALFFPLPEDLLRTGEILGSIIVAGALAVLGLALRRGKTAAAPGHGVLARWPFLQKGWIFFQHLTEGIRKIGRSRLLLAGALGLSILKLAIQCLAFLSLLWAYGFRFSIWVELAVFLIAYVGISIPSTPASVGVFQLFCVAGLRLFGVEKTAATGFALLAFVVLTAPLSVAGFVALAQSGLTLRQIRTEVGQWNPNGKL
ncbi:MAG TPA: lysylphosphatidylglycerol synthase transmembrane domain-containing protein [Candidatus Sulfotelmatobacter sp.]|nr:lysylphosphatidylglycerol synthase transmembrane domain-containing protein [Candidatus Sulfotelmatobacter sp.]